MWFPTYFFLGNLNFHWVSTLGNPENRSTVVSYLMETSEKCEVYMWFPLCLHGESWGFHLVSLMFTLGNPDFLVVFLMFLFGNLGFPCGFPIFHTEKPLFDPSFHAMEACKPKHRVFPLEGNHMEKGNFQDGNPMEICCKLVVSMWFPLCLPWREMYFFTQYDRRKFQLSRLVIFSVVSSLNIHHIGPVTTLVWLTLGEKKGFPFEGNIKGNHMENSTFLTSFHKIGNYCAPVFGIPLLGNRRKLSCYLLVSGKWHRNTKISVQFLFILFWKLSFKYDIWISFF